MDNGPDVISSFGFGHAPVSQFLLVSTSFSSVAISFLPDKYRKLITLTWMDVVNRKQILRFISSQFIVDGSFEVICNCLLIYYFLVLERRWGSAKYISFFFTNWSLSLGLYFIIFKSRLFDNNIPFMETVPKGIYGPIFSMLVYYYKDVKSHNNSNSTFPITKKMFVYMLAVQIMLSNEKTFLMASCGIVSGIIYRLNVLKIQSWFTLPKAISGTFHKLYSYFISNESATSSKKSLMGATPEVHEDMVFDYMMKRQQQHMRTDVRNRLNVAQGYSDIINPSFAQLFGNIQRAEPTVPQPPQPDTGASDDVLNADDVSDDIPEEKVRTLVDMGFTRDAVVDALTSSNNDLQQATSILLSATQ